MRSNEERVWAGSETSLQAATEAEQALTERLAAGGMGDEDKDERGPRLLSVEEGIATVAIKGPLVNSDSPYLEYFGVTGYPEIREAMLAAANDETVKQIFLDIDSGGGAVSGCDDTGKLIRLVSDKVKPVTAFTDGICASAAYWLGSSAGEFYSGKSALVGSIGIIATFKEYSKRNEMEGITATVIRAGKHKALANQNEKLTPAAEAQIKALVDASYTVFVEHVADMRGKSFEYADKTMADGQEFIGQAAVDVGLSDGTTTYDAVITELKKKVVASEQKRIDNTHNDRFGLSGSLTQGEAPMAKKALTEADIAALAAGAQAPEDLAAVIAPLDPAEGVTEGSVEGTTEGVVANAEASASVTSDNKSPVSEKVVAVDATVQLLNSQLQAKDALLLEAGIKIAGLQAFKDQYEAVLQPLKDIVGRSASIMHIAQGGSARDFASMQPADLVAEHARLAVGFSKFPVGGVAAVASDLNAKNERPAPGGLAQARLDAVRFSR